MPGMTEGHAHLSFDAVTATEDLIRPSPEEHTLLTARVAKTLLDHGFTSAYGASEAKLRLGVAVRNEIEAGRLEGPRIRAGSLRSEERRVATGSRLWRYAVSGKCTSRVVLKRQL